MVHCIADFIMPLLIEHWRSKGKQKSLYDLHYALNKRRICINYDFTLFIFRHVVFAPSSKDSYAGAAFPGLVDLLFEINMAKDPRNRWEQVREHLAEVIYMIKAATAIMAPYTAF